MRTRVALFSVVAIFGASSFLAAAVIPFSLGTNLNQWGNGDEVPYTGAGNIQDVTSGNPAPFNAPIGNDVLGPNFSTNWSHNIAAVAGQTVAGATISFGIWGHEPNLFGNQVASFTLTTDGVNLFTMTGPLNSLFEASVDGTTGQNTYNVYSIDLGAFNSAILTALQNDLNATFHLALQGSQNSTGDQFNSAQITGASLIITAASETTGVPEPSSMLLLSGVAGLFGLARHRRRRKQTPESEAVDAA